MFLLKYVVGPFVGTVIGRALLEVCHRFDWRPEDQLAGFMVAVVTPAISELAGWTLAAIGGIGLYAIAYYFLFVRRAAPEPSTQEQLTSDVERAPIRAGSTASNFLSANFIDDDSIKLGGVTAALLERSLRYDFRLPLPTGDLFLQRYEMLKNSEHPIWTDKAISQLRREFFHYVGQVGSSHKFGTSKEEYEADRLKLESFGRQLIEKLTGVQSLGTKTPTLRDNKLNEFFWIDKDQPLHHVRSIPDNLLFVERFALQGTSNRSSPIVVKDAYLQSLVGSGERLPITILGIPAAEADIQPQASFEVAAKFPNEAPPGASVRGMQPENFWKRFSRFDFFIETEEQSYVITYGEETTQPFLDGLASMRMGAPGEPARVLRRKKAK